MTQDNQSLTTVSTLTDSANYQSDPLSVYQLLCHNKENNLLLESAEITQKHLLKSLLLTDAAVKIVCNGHTVTFSALTLNGQAAVQFAAVQLKTHAQLSLTEDQQTLTAIFPNIPTELDEKARLMAINPFESLRLFNRLENSHNHHFAIFLGGAFAFDMIAMSETLPDVPDGENTCPDFVYYLAETLVIIDHEIKSTEIIANIFSAKSEKIQAQVQQQLTARISNIKQKLSTNITPEHVSALVADKSSSAQHINHAESQEVSVDISDEVFCQTVELLKENIRAGDIFQVVPSRTFSIPCIDSVA
ncbi:MAG: anthranilate synthase component 1, partial [Colwellia sp.]